MSAIIYNKSSSLGYDKTLVLGPRTGVTIPFNFPAWTETRIGIFFTGVSTASLFVSKSVTEVLSISSNSNYFAVGLASGSSIANFGSVGTNFVGAISDGNPILMTDSQIALMNFQNYGVQSGACRGTAIQVGGSYQTNSPTFQFNPAENSAGSYNGFKGLKFTVNNPGASNQTITVGFTPQTVPAGPYTIAALQSLINNSTYYNFPTNLTWNSGSVALPLPDNFYMWNPYYTNGIRLSALAVVRVN